eukprot:GFYU01002412.1.p1 GENE.GFYU01002412.1~~GFYU01002412.1.p1  ORF type:complete len:297 (-),score=121.28 GFYU01002412.1:157-1047(-)
MEILILYVVVIALIAIIGTFLLRRTENASKEENQSSNVDDEVVAGGRKGGLSRMKKRKPAQGTSGAAAQEDEDEDELSFDEDGPLTKDQKKRLNKVIKKQDKKERTKARDAGIEAREEKKRMEADKRRERELLEEEEEQRKREEAEKLKEEERKKEQEEYEAWKASMAIEVEGSGEAEIAEESQGLLNEFISYLKTQKVVVLDELANKYGLKAKDMINRIQGLQDMGRITGLMDDRGKFIYISPEEMQAVAKYIKKKGRVSINELANESNKLINMTATEKKEVATVDLDLTVEGEG